MTERSSLYQCFSPGDRSTVSLDELRGSHCRWPFDGEPPRYCGAKVIIGQGPYCKAHAQLAYQPPKSRERKRFDQALRQNDRDRQARALGHRKVSA